uniref:RNA-directed DNA polymerase n=1 Tax=Trichuris muris TaxID=70415 RepID=A0A5S6QL65_TRIMR
MSTNGLGLCSKIKASLRLKPDASPVFRPKRPVPYAAVPKVDAELNRLEKLGVISKVSHSNWAAPIVVVKKANGSFRVCADFSTGLNNMLELHQYPLPTPEELFTVLNGGRLFSKLDFADAYLQVEVEDNSKELLTINTHLGFYRYNRLPFGVKSAPGIFQQIMDTMIAGLNGTVAYLDDVLVVGRTLEEHNRNLKAVLNRVMEFGFRIRPEKCQIGVKEIRYLGYIVNEHGRRPDPDKIAAIQRMPPPFDVQSLRSFLGMLSYYGVFVKQMRELRAPLDELLKKGASFIWSSECQSAFEKAKLILKSDRIILPRRPP